jgi:uncharacterized DUF497 family protein
MAIVFDPAKSQRNLRERGLSFERAKDFDFATAYIEVDRRFNYGEVRFNAVGFLDGRMHTLVFTERGDDMRIISLRKASRTEMRTYDEIQG